MSVTTLLVARHGNTFDPGDVVRRVGARTDLPLSASGLAQAARLGHWLRANHLLPDLVVTSTLRRTQQTAQQALRAAAHDAPCETLALFDEIDYGPDENQPEDQVVARLGKEALETWESASIVPPGWHVDPAALQRGWQEFAAGIAESGRIIMVVTSNGVARFAPAATGDMAGFRARYQGKLGTGALGLLRHDDTGWQVTGWNIKPD